MKDWKWWDRLTEEETERNGPYAYFAAWERVMGSWFDEEPWWDELETWDRVALFSCMCDLREWAEKEPTE